MVLEKGRDGNSKPHCPRHDVQDGFNVALNVSLFHHKGNGARVVEEQHGIVSKDSCKSKDVAKPLYFTGFKVP